MAVYRQLLVFTLADSKKDSSFADISTSLLAQNSHNFLCEFEKYVKTRRYEVVYTHYFNCYGLRHKQNKSFSSITNYDVIGVKSGH